jgi:hypothetical protein
MLIKIIIMNEIQAIKPGPKPDKQDGTPDERRRVTPENQPKHPKLRPHEHEPKD